MLNRLTIGESRGQLPSPKFEETSKPPPHGRERDTQIRLRAYVRTTSSKERWLQNLDHESLDAANLHNVEAVPRAHFVLHAVQVILHRLLGQAETICNFFIGQPLGD